MIKITSIKDILIYLISDNYKLRFIGETLELGFRIHKLETMLAKTDKERGFEFNCPRYILNIQLENMRALYNVYLLRSKQENIEIPEADYER